MVRRTEKQGTSAQTVAPVWTGRLRARTKRSGGPEVRTSTFKPHAQPKKSSEHDRESARKDAAAKQRVERRRQTSDETRSRMQAADALRKAKSRSEETEATTKERRMKDSKRHSLARANESAKAALARKQHDRDRHASTSQQSLGIARKDTQVKENYLGKMSLQCSSCKALHFEGEMPQSKMFNSCCRHGLVELPMFETFPKELHELYIGSTPEAIEFRKNLRSYNNSLAMGCMKAQLDVPRGGPYTFRLHGQVYHLIGPLHPADGQDHVFAQVFILDTEDAAEELANRKINRMCSKELFKTLIEILNKYNPFVKSLKMMKEMEEEEETLARSQNREVQDIRMVFREGKKFNPHRYQLPTANEVAVVFVGDEDEIPGRREITVYQRSGKLQNLRDTDKETDPLCYPLLFIDGRYGWHIDCKRKKEQDGGEVKMSTREFYAYYLHVRPSFNPLHYAKKLFQQFCVDIWTKIEQDRLNFIRSKQDMLRVESVQGLMDHVSGEDGGPCGTRVFLPGSFAGSPRHMVGQFQDALTVVSKYGKPDLFVTITCNPNWREIKESLSPGQVATDRPDVVARVFNLKIEVVKKDIFEKHVYGEAASWIYVVEFQKRGLPHVHMLVILKDAWKPRTATQVDEIVCAELPDQDADPELFEIVSTLMMHRPCGAYDPEAPCMKNGKCSKGYPKEFRSTTSVDVDGFPLYRRRDDGKKVPFKTKSGEIVWLDNRSVVPYNKYFTRKFNCHVNVEICGTVGAVKYLFKYIYKGNTRAAVHIFTDKTGTSHRVDDEIDSYLDTRYVCAPEALHHIFGFKMSDRSTPVMQLKVHLENAQGVVFRKGEEKDAMEKAQVRETTLTAWFAANQKCEDELQTSGMIPENIVDSRGIHYVEMPEHFQFTKGKWVPRKRSTKCIGRMHFVSPRDQERFALRLLLLNIVDAKSYKDLNTIGGVYYEKCVDAAKAAGYLTDDCFYEQSLEEAASFHSAFQLRGFFVTLLMFGEIHNAEELWYKFRDVFCEDFVYQNFPKEKAEALAYNDISERIQNMGENLEKWMKLDYERIHPEDMIDHDFCRQEGEKMRALLSPEQEAVVKVALEALANGGGQIFVDGPGGSGKTYVYLCLINIMLGMHLKVVPLAWIGNAACLLPHGRTVASFFRMNIKDGCKTSTMHHQSMEAKALADLDAVLWDEAPMSPKASLETADQLFRDVTGVDAPFGGKLIILGGDFRQCLPVMDKKGEEEQIANSIKKSKLWPLFRVMHLTSNMRLTDGNEEWKR
ncbi:hypothetical protein CRE_27833 [Caenorhabditis remanei]|uniref:ATP-dependent DNA helicase n=1 Tax=Caenorhabditis remanei TaxID=31234 RepID=E3NA78_CAERE|nr:hypothetical protein CRE_27833 [Caenorhabditis remanei]